MKKSTGTSPRGFSLLEVLVSAFILSILSVSILHGLTTLEMESHLAKDRMSAALLAADIREEILSKPSVEPLQPPRLGPEPGEGGANRITYDDQDDYGGLVDRPASDIGGLPVYGMNHLWRTVTIERVSPEHPSGASIDTGPFGLRRFTVMVFKDRAELARLVWLGVGQVPSSGHPSMRASRP